ncbi:MAG: polyprenyl synthetase family protein [Kiritimatiellae bacterium]|nr:polyprenyl synthetase family protein [Kiritimatiellia bacterium]
MLDVARYMEEKRVRVDAALDRYLPAETERPAVLHKAMRYSIFCGGKRIRPILCLAAAETLGAPNDAAMLPAVALECLHTYTLIHDDLPSMDNDDLRRGKPTSHKVFGEANAILAGDSLLTLAFELLAQGPQPGRLALELAQAAGSRGVAGGQFEDLASEGKEPDAAQVEFIHICKTGKLIQAACRMGAIAAGAGDQQLDALSRYGERVGLAFQIADDILNATSTPEALGKAAGSDAARGKMTYVSLYGVDRARAEAKKLVEEAVRALGKLPQPSEPLAALARFVIERQA